jgi:ADP-ribose pyrophosphatase
MDEATSRMRYDQIRAAFPDAFVNPPDAPIELLLDPAEVSAAEQAMSEALAKEGMSTSWARTGVAYEDQFMLIVRDAVRMPNGRLGTYIRTIDSGQGAGVVILPRHRGKVVVIRHFRHSTRSWHLEIPRGFGTPGRTPEEDVRRELQEEIGVIPTTLESLGVVYPDTGLQGAAVHLFYAEIEDIPTITDDDEGIGAIRFVSPTELSQLIRDGEINDGFTIAAYTRATLRGFLPS